MWWHEGRRSDNIEDQRGTSLPRGVRVGGMGGLGVLVLVVLAMVFGIDPRALLQEGPSVDSPYVSVPPNQGPGGAVSGHDELRDFVAVVLGDTEDTMAGSVPQGRADVRASEAGALLEGRPVGVWRGRLTGDERPWR